MNDKYFHKVLDIESVSGARAIKLLSCYWRHNYIICLICVLDVSKYSVGAPRFLFTKRSARAQNPLP